MASQTFYYKYKKNTGRIFSADDIRRLYFFGIPIIDPDTGEEMADSTIEFYIDAMQKEMENDLSILFKKQLYFENRDFYYDQWIKWNYLTTTYFAVEAVSVQGFLNTTLQLDYPDEWLSTKDSSDGILYYRKINLVPIHGSANSLSGNAIYVGVAPYVGYFGNDHIPNYWHITYMTGWDKVPADIVNAVGKMVAINIFHQLGDIIVGAGIAGKSIGVDGLNQSIQTTASATNSGYGARIKGYLADLERTIPLLRNTYKGIRFSVV